MGYKTIVAHLTTETQARQAIAAGSMLARSGDAHLTGLYVVPAPRVVAASAYGAADVAGILLEQHLAFHEQKSNQIKALFDHAMASELFQSDWVKVDSHRVDPLATILERGRAAELIVAVQSDPDEPDGIGATMAERLMMEAGRPVLVVPPTGTIETLGRDITVAWNGSRESARAVFDALPLLQEAAMVHVLWINPAADSQADDDVSGAALAATLARAGVTCEAMVASARNGEVGDELCARLAEHGSDLLVMGGYGHPRLQQWIFGGVTRQILSEMPVPVLLSH